MELIQVSNQILSDGTRYSGWGYNRDGEFIPNGCGKKFFAGYYIYGNFKHGFVDGPAIESHDMYMYTMQYKNDFGNGWGLCLNRGQLIEFGYYENNILKVNLSDFALWYFTKMRNASRDENMLSIYTFNSSHEVSELLIGYKPTSIEKGVGLVGMGFHFMADGSVWMGNTATRRFSGKLIHFNSNGTVDCGDFDNGELTKRMNLQEIINTYYGTHDFSENDIFACMLKKREPNSIREQFRNAKEIEVGRNYFQKISNTETPPVNITNQFSMEYTLTDVDFEGKGNFIPLGNGIDNGEKWIIGDTQIVTPHGVLKIDDAIFVEEGPLVGVKFSVSGILRMNDFKCSEGNEDDIQVSTFAVMRQPYNAWLWCYAFDEDDAPVANFCGTDLIDGLSNFIPFLKRKYLKK